MGSDDTTADRTQSDDDAAPTSTTEIDETMLAEVSDRGLDEPPASYTSDLRDLRELPTVPVDAYDMIGEFARGGLGRISEARDRRLDRVVAIKELRRNTRYAVSRFSREVRITAKLQHPNIVPLHEAGRWPTGEPFFAMKLVAGGSLEDSIEACKTMRERLALVKCVADVADAIAYAHSHHIVHRDLKPSNVLVGPFGETVVIDWGLAKDLREEDDELAEQHVTQPRDEYQTTDGVVLGTPPYMPPEQATGKHVDERADVYALGAILYHLLSGRVPYFEYHPRDVVTKVATRPPSPLSRVQPEVPPDLLAIVEKSMQREPSDRYANAGEMAEELHRFVDGGLVAAYSYSFTELFRRFVSRHRAAVATGALGVVVLAAVGTWSVISIDEERDIAVAERHKAVKNEADAVAAKKEAETRLAESTLERAREAVSSDPTSAVALLKTLKQSIHGAASVAADAVERGVAERVFEGHTDQVEAVVFSPDSRTLFTSGLDKKVFAWALAGGEPRVIEGHSDRIPALAPTRDGRSLLSASYDGSVRRWQLDNLSPTVLPPRIGPAKAVAVSADGKHAIAVGDEGVHLFPLAGRGEGHATRVAAGRPVFASFSPDNKRAITGSHGATLRLWSVEGGDPVVLKGHRGEVRDARFSPNGARIVSGGEDGTVRVWSSAGEEERVLEGHDGAVVAVAFADDDHVISGGMDGIARRWRLADGKKEIIARHLERISAVAVSPDARFVACASWDRIVSLYDRVTGSVQSLRGHHDVVTNVAFSPDGKHLASVSWDHDARLWRVEANARRTLSGHHEGVKTVAFSPDGKLLASGGHDNVVRLWDASSGTMLHELRGHTDHVFRVLFSPDGKRIASSSDDKTVRLWPVDGGDPRVLEGHKADVEELAFSPDGRALASAGDEPSVWLWNLDDGRGRALASHEAPVTAVAFTHDGASLVSAGRDGAVVVWSRDGTARQRIAAHTGEAKGLALDPKSPRVASVGSDDTLRIWSLADGSKLLEKGPLVGAERVAFASDGRHVAVSSSNGKVWLCDAVADDKTPCRELEGHSTRVHSLAFSDDAQTLVTGSGDGTVRLFSAVTGENRTLRGHLAPVFDVALAPGNALVASASGDTTIRLWPATPPPTPEALASWLGEATSYVVH